MAERVVAVVTLIDQPVVVLATIENEPDPDFVRPAYVHAVLKWAVPVVADVGTIHVQTQAPALGCVGFGSDALAPLGYVTDSVHVGPTGAFTVTFAVPPNATGDLAPTV